MNQLFPTNGVATFEWTAQRTLVWWQIEWEPTPGAGNVEIIAMMVRGEPLEPSAKPVTLKPGDKVGIAFKGKPGEAICAAFRMSWLAD
jgi:hypothetical protein